MAKLVSQILFALAMVINIAQFLLPQASAHHEHSTETTISAFVAGALDSAPGAALDSCSGPCHTLSGHCAFAHVLSLSNQPSLVLVDALDLGFVIREERAHQGPDLATLRRPPKA